MKTTVNNFFWYANAIDSYLLNKDNCGNQHHSKGWITILNGRYSLKVSTMPKESFSGVIIDTHDKNKEIHLNAYTLHSIIKTANEFIESN